MSRSSGHIHIIREQSYITDLAEGLDYRGYFTDVISTSNWSLGKLGIGFLSFDGGHLSAICVMTRFGAVVTKKLGIRFDNVVDFEPISFATLLSEIPDKFSRYLLPILENYSGGSVPDSTWVALVETVKRLRPDTTNEINRLERYVKKGQRPLIGKVYETLVDEKDGYELLIRAAGFEDIANASVISYPNDGDALPVPFMRGIGANRLKKREVQLMEDRAIENDVQLVSEWDKIGNYVTGEMVFVKDDMVLSIANVNRHRVEDTLGVDVIYYQHEYQSFTLVQYKKLRKDADGILRYRPSGSYFNELEKMRKFRSNNPVQTEPISKLSEFRLNPDAFFFKFHDGVMFSPLDIGLCKGMYVPLSYWESFIEFPESKGEKGGLYVNYENIGRYLNNTDFLTLIKNGWIGSKGTDTTKLKVIIDELIDQGHSVMIGIKQRL